MTLTPGTRLGPYEILSAIAAGGMGEVYRARHVKLGREAAIKVLPSELASDPERLRRFEREARAASALNHPGIVTIYDIDEHEGTLYIAMELVEGTTLRERLQGARLEPKEAVRIAAAIADGLALAHDAGIVHRDLKPDNVMITRDGHVKILDFGLAKQVPVGAEAGSDLATVSRSTVQGAVLGTVPYMSPEQAAGRAVDHLSDQFSFGVVLYEMLCGRRPFSGESVGTVLSAILRDAPPPPRSLRPDLPRDVERVVHRCLEKDPKNRYPSARETGEALRRCEAGLARATGRLSLDPRLVAAALVVVALAAGTAAWFRFRDGILRWRERDRIAEVSRLTEAGSLEEAFLLARRVEQKIPNDPEVEKMLDRITLRVSIVTRPPGATVELKPYSTPDVPWENLGETPLQGVRVPYALMRWKISKDGFETFEGAPFGERPFVTFAQGFTLDPVGSRPDGMVRVPGGPYVRPGFPPVRLEDYWLDRYEVTNRQYKQFVDQGGYQNADYWKEPFVDEGRKIPRERALARLVDKTGRPGPAGWEFATYDEGKADFPVGGVSWYEADAYCRSVGKSLPTLYHWSAASAQDQFSDIVRFSNFAGDGPVSVGGRSGLGDFGTYDMAGNVKEWCWNGAPAGRYILGGAWGDPTYMFKRDADSRPPLSREPTQGFRCALYPKPPDESLLASVTTSYLAPRREPVDDSVFEAYRRLYAYDPTSLKATVDAVDDSSPQWREETVSFDAAYGGERVIAHLFLPRNVAPPYQPVVWFPGNDVFFRRAGEALASSYLFDFIPRSGRALVYPVYKGTYERSAPVSFEPNRWRDLIVLWSKDLSRTVDYLEGRTDIDASKVAYYGFSSGAIFGPIFTAVDPRFRASVLLAGGLYGDLPPEADAVNFAPRSRVPTLMVNGENDFICPFETSQKPLFRLLGAPQSEKRQARLPGGHIPPDRLAMIKEIVAWLDRSLGPVAPAPDSPGS
jgi:predicted esterase